MSLDLDTFTRAAEILDHRRLAEHEAGHAAAGLLLGLDVASVHAPYWTTEDAAAADPSESAGATRITHDPAKAREYAIAVLAGPLNEDRVHWPPTWPLSLAPQTSDEAQVGELVKALDLDEQGYRALTRDALTLSATREFERLALAIGHMLERHAHLDAPTLHRIKAITEGAEVDHLLLKVVTTVSTDQGTFEAVISTEGVDREKDIVRKQQPDSSRGTRSRWGRGWTQPASTGTNSCSASPGETRMSPRTGRSPEFQTVCGHPRGTKTRPPAMTGTSRSPSRNVVSPSAT